MGFSEAYWNFLYFLLRVVGFLFVIVGLLALGRVFGFFPSQESLPTVEHNKSVLVFDATVLLFLGFGAIFFKRLVRK